MDYIDEAAVSRRFVFKGVGEDMECIVIGAGVSGLAVAEQLLERGWGVTVLERGSAGQESTWAGGGILSPLCPWDYSEEVNRLAMRGASLFPAWTEHLYATTGIDPEYQRCGMLVLPPYDEAGALAWCASHGVEVRQEYRIDKVSQSGLFLPQVAQARNPRLLKALLARVRSLGAKLIEHCEVQRLIVGGRRVQGVTTTRGEYYADSVVVAAGAWSAGVMAEVMPQLPVYPVRGQMLLFKFHEPVLPCIVLQEGMYLIPRRDGHLLVGSTLEEAGFDKRTTGEAGVMLRQKAEAILPVLKEMLVERQWAGLRPGSPDNLPFIGKHPEFENIYINTGHFRYGVTMAPACAEIVAQAVVG